MALCTVLSVLSSCGQDSAQARLRRSANHDAVALIFRAPWFHSTTKKAITDAILRGTVRDTVRAWEQEMGPEGKTKQISLMNSAERWTAAQDWQDHVIQNYASKLFPPGSLVRIDKSVLRKLFPIKDFFLMHHDVVRNAGAVDWHRDSSSFRNLNSVLFVSLTTLNAQVGKRSGTLYPPSGGSLPELDLSTWNKRSARSADNVGAISTHLTSRPPGNARWFGVGPFGTRHRSGIDVDNNRVVAGLCIGWNPNGDVLRGSLYGDRLMLLHWQHVLDQVSGSSKGYSLANRLLVTSMDGFIETAELRCEYEKIETQFKQLSASQQSTVKQAFGGTFPPSFPGDCNQGGTCRPR